MSRKKGSLAWDFASQSELLIQGAKKRRQTSLLNAIKQMEQFATNLMLLVKEERGSAIVEFTMLAIPLLVPIVMYLGAIHQNSAIESDLHNLARQGARAFITSPSDAFEGARLQSVIDIFVTKIFQKDGISEIPSLSVECSASPCLTPDAKVKVTASLIHNRGNLSGILRFISTPSVTFSASDTQVVDAWR